MRILLPGMSPGGNRKEHLMKKFIISLVAALFAMGGAAFSDETRISLGYEIIDQEDDAVGGKEKSSGNGWYLLGEGDKGDFLYRLSYRDRSQELDDKSRKFDVSVTDAYFGWHGLYLGQAGFGAAFNHIMIESGSDEADRTVAGLLMRSESDQIDWTLSLGAIVNSDNLDSGLAFLVGADIHVSQAVTLTGGWNRLDGEYKNGGEDATIDVFDLGARYRFADMFFVEGGVELVNGTSDALAGADSSSTTFSLGIGTTF